MVVRTITELINSQHFLLPQNNSIIHTKAKAAAVYDELGIDLPTAIRMFLKRSVVVNGVPFSMTLPKQEYRAERAIRAVQSLSEAAQQNGTADMSLDEINAEIAVSRADRASRNARNGA